MILCIVHDIAIRYSIKKLEPWENYLLITMYKRKPTKITYKNNQNLNSNHREGIHPILRDVTMMGIGCLKKIIHNSY